MPQIGQAQVSTAIVSTHSATLEIPVMTRALPLFGFKAEGFAANWDQLTRLKIPVIVYLKHRKNDHFSVLRGINKDTVLLADPSMGNRTYSRQPTADSRQPTAIFGHVANAPRHTKRRLIREVFGGLAHACKYQGDRQFFHQNTRETNHRRHAVARYALAAQLIF